MKIMTKERWINAGIIAFAGAPLWLTGTFALINPHDMVLIDQRGGRLSRMTSTMECQQRGGCFSFDKTGRIEQTVGVGNSWIYRFNAQAKPRITHAIAAPKLGGVMQNDLKSPDAAHIAHAHKLHQTACAVVREHKLSGYQALNCG